MATHTLMGGKLHVYKRENSSVWQCSTFMGGKNRRRSTKCESLEEAKDYAEDWFLQMKLKNRAGLLKNEHTFKQAAEQFKREYEIITEGQRNATYVTGHWTRLEKYLLPFFGHMGLSEITAGKLQEYRIHRKETFEPRYKDGDDLTPEEQARYEAAKKKGPARNTVHQEIVTLRQTLKTAIRHGWLQHLPDLSEPYRTNVKISHRAWFSPEEYKKLYQATRARALNPKKKNRYKWVSEQTHDYVLFMANTGLRPDEARRLEYRDVTIVKDASTEETILEIEVRGKRGVGYCKSMPGAAIPFRRLKKRNNGQPTDRIFPKFSYELFNAVLAEENLKFDREGQRRTPYSLRHTYICLRLMEGADIYQIAKNCRTSVDMIEKYYASHIKTSIDASAINVRKLKPPKARVQAALAAQEGS
ncbi:MAG: phage integrase SAM-like domain-containing protein [Proteobacteria bacterium]|nr:phage integrase SAM-like domain-containing protein [Pseudomonadota bacterium]